jgi:hypothetical protein
MLKSRFVNWTIISAYIGGMVYLAIALWRVGNCISFSLNQADLGSIWSQADRKTWLT